MSLDWNKITQKVAEIVSALEPFANVAVGVVAPEVAPALVIGEKIIHGLINAEPTAVALVNQIKSGAEPTPAQLQQFSDNYEASYQKLKADIAAKLAE